MGIATAFGAPIGGLLFAFEELASSFSQALGWQIFFACMLAVLTLDTFKSAQHALKQGHFGLFDGDASTVFFEVCRRLMAHSRACDGSMSSACLWTLALRAARHCLLEAASCVLSLKILLSSACVDRQPASVLCLLPCRFQLCSYSSP